MKRIISSAISGAALLALSACGQGKDSTTEAQGGGTVVEGDEWTAKPDQPDAVDVQLPETPVKMAPKTPAEEAPAQDGAAPAPGQ